MRKESEGDEEQSVLRVTVSGRDGFVSSEDTDIPVHRQTNGHMHD